MNRIDRLKKKYRRWGWWLTINIFKILNAYCVKCANINVHLLFLLSYVCLRIPSQKNAFVRHFSFHFSKIVSSNVILIKLLSPAIDMCTCIDASLCTPLFDVKLWTCLCRHINVRFQNTQLKDFLQKEKKKKKENRQDRIALHLIQFHFPLSSKEPFLIEANLLWISAVL